MEVVKAGNSLWVNLKPASHSVDDEQRLTSYDSRVCRHADSVHGFSYSVSSPENIVIAGSDEQAALLGTSIIMICSAVCGPGP